MPGFSRGVWQLFCRSYSDYSNFNTGTFGFVQGGLAANEEDDDALARTINTTDTYWYAKVRPVLKQP